MFLLQQYQYMHVSFCINFTHIIVLFFIQQVRTICAFLKTQS